MEEQTGVATINAALCTECLACVEVCPKGAIQQVQSTALVPAGRGEVVEGEVIDRQVIPVPSPAPLVPAQAPGRLATLAGAALSFVGNWLLPRAADALVGAAERRLANRSNPAAPGTSLRFWDNTGQRPASGGRGGRGRQRRRRRRGR